MLNPSKNDIEVVNLGASYISNGRSLEVFKDLQFSLDRGKLVAIIGPSGCGKSTLLRILANLLQSLSDKLLLSGKVERHPEREKKCAIIEQSPALFPWRTAFQNVCMGAELRAGLNVWKCGRIRDSFKEYQLHGFEDSFPTELSGGMQQRVAILRALNSEPDLLYCDEPFSAIDFVTRLYLNKLFKGMCRELKCTTIFITHNIEEAIFLADRIIVLSNRPCRIIDDFVPYLSRHSTDPVKCRESPEFSQYFSRIWRMLEPTSA
jgi:NitT/TauT family transport system ATP-binding protein